MGSFYPFCASVWPLKGFLVFSDKKIGLVLSDALKASEGFLGRINGKSPLAAYNAATLFA